MRAPIIGFRAWNVERPIRHKIPGTGRGPVDVQWERVGLASPPTELKAWLEDQTKRQPRRYETVEPELEVGTLTALTYRHDEQTWAKPAPVHFSCRFHGHARPVRECTCGLYACLTAEQAVEVGGYVVGAVAAWGHLILHGVDGFRAEWMRIVALATPPDRVEGGRTAQSPPGLWTRKAAERLGVPAVPFARLEQVGREFGTVITWEYRFE